MAVLTWDAVGSKTYETGVSKGILFVKDKSGAYTAGKAWSGMTAVNENPSGAESNPIFADNKKYLNLVSAEEYGCTIEAYTYPDEFAECDGSAQLAAGVTIGQQPRKGFGFAYRTEIGDDAEGINKGYKIHLVYNCQAAPSGKAYQTINNSMEATTFSWEITTTPVEVEGHKPTATITIDSTKVESGKLKAIEDMLYGTSSEESKLPSVSELITLLKGSGSLPA